MDLKSTTQVKTGINSALLMRGLLDCDTLLLGVE